MSHFLNDDSTIFRRKFFLRIERHANREFNVGDKVWLDVRNIATKKLSKKLNNKRLGPYTIMRRSGTQAYELNVLKRRRIHNVFNVQILEPVIGPNAAEGDADEPMEEEQEWEVFDVLDSRVVDGTLHYLVHWKGFPKEEVTWESAGIYNI